jgi:anti-anti-sigma factor
MPEALYILSTLESGVRVLELRLPPQMDVISFDDLNLALTDEFDRAPGDYIIDLSATDYVGSAVLGLLVNIRSRVRRSGGRLVLCRLSPRILEIFRIGSLESLFTISATRETAIETLAGR